LTATLKTELMTVSITLVCACTSATTPGPGASIDAPVTVHHDAAPATTACGTPGDPGNELGVGKYCTAIADCNGLPASLCAVIADPNAHICTEPCSSGSMTCGTNASCQCQGALCGCVPNSCVD
jgi:hypothetical protein